MICLKLFKISFNKFRLNVRDVDRLAGKEFRDTGLTGGSYSTAGLEAIFRNGFHKGYRAAEDHVNTLEEAAIKAIEKGEKL